MTNETWAMIQVMKASGGSFVQALAVCFERADADNLERLRRAFPEYVEQYTARGRAAVRHLEDQGDRALSDTIDRIAREGPPDGVVKP